MGCGLFDTTISGKARVAFARAPGLRFTDSAEFACSSNPTHSLRYFDISISGLAVLSPLGIQVPASLRPLTPPMISLWSSTRRLNLCSRALLPGLQRPSHTPGQSRELCSMPPWCNTTELSRFHRSQLSLYSTSSGGREPTTRPVRLISSNCASLGKVSWQNSTREYGSVSTRW